MKKEMLINVLQPEECRIAIVEDGVLEELYVERASQETYVGNIYKGRIVNIEPSIQAAFVDFGIGRNGFLHVSDVDPVYYKHLLPKDVLAELEAEQAAEAEGGRGRDRGDRGERGDRRDRGRDRDRRDWDRDRGRGPRVTEPESSVTVPAERREVSPATYTAEEDEASFGEGLLDDAAPTPPAARERERAEEPRPAPPPRRPARREAVEREPVAAEPMDDADFGAGIVNDEPAAAVESPAAEEPPPLPEAAEPEAEAPAAEERPKSRGRSRSRARKADEPAEETAEAKEPEPKAKGKTARRGRKKSDGESGEEPSAGEGDDQPRPMPGAERRTTGDDEPEIKPFFEGGLTDDFDVEGSNDRFADGGETEAEAGEAPAEFDDAEGGADDSVEDEGEEPELVTADRGGAEPDEDEFAPPPRRGFDEGDEYGRGRGRDRGRSRGRGRRRDGGPDRGGRPGGARERGFPRPPIQEIFKRGQEVIVQVIKEGIGTKGPTLSTFISIAGRYLVLMPSLNRVGVSRKIEDQDARRRLREIMTTLNPPKGVGFIVRTAAVDRNERELQNDLAYLLRLWQVVVRRIKKMPAPVEIYRESDMITRTIRDIFTNDIDTIWVDEPTAFAHASEFLQIVMPRFASRIRYFAESEPLFHRYGIEEEIAKINQKRIDLPQGGSIIIEQTEALVAIDVNSGTFRADNNAEETAFRMNLLAAKEIARQLRLRDLGGVIVNDFIDMRDPDHRRRVENAMRDALKRDRARTKILRISQFGIIEMTRQRIQPSLKKRIFNDCPHCKGTGYVKTNETMGIEVMRLLQLAAHRSPAVTSVTLTVHADVAFYLLNRKRKEIAALEEKAKMEVQVHGQFGVSPDLLEFRCLDSNGNEVRLFGSPPPRMFRGGDRDRGGRQYDRRRGED
jgi:ribonuclease E